MARDPSLNDEQLEDEIRLVGDLVLAASQHQGHLSQDEVDEVLGLQRPRPRARAVAGHVREARRSLIGADPVTRRPGVGPSL